MKTLEAYLFFDGNCSEAMQFYQRCFGGELNSMTIGDTPQYNGPPGNEDKILHACLVTGSFNLMASDNPYGAPVVGDNVQLTVQCDSLDEIEKLFKLLADGGRIKQALENTFWGARFGMLTDRYGIHWMLNYPMDQRQ